MPEPVRGPAAARRLRALQLGLEWFTHGAGGGASRVMADLVRSLPSVGVAVCGAVAGPADVEALTDGCVESFGVHGAWIGRRLLGARLVVDRLLRARAIDVVAVHFALYAAPCLDRLGSVPLVMHFHGPWAAESRREGNGRAAVAAKYAVERMVYRRAARVIVLSDAFAAVVRRDYGIPEERLRIVPGSTDVARFAVRETRAEARLRLGWPNDRKLLLTVRRLAARMGLGGLIEAMVAVARAEPRVLLHIVGCGPQEGALRQQVEQLQLSQHVRFLGFVPDPELPLVYRAADVNLVPTTELEGFGLTAAEALAAGTPSMVTPVGGLPEVVSKLSRALVFRSSSPSDLAEGLIGVLSGAVVLPDARQCASYAADHFGAERMAAEVAAVYREVS
jgi:glycosyltransferase involved in cell wall biosynthesis